MIVIGVEIGRGSFGVVRKCTVDGKLVAVKIVRNDFSLEAGEALNFLKSEIEILSTITDHPNIVKYVGHQVNLRTNINIFLFIFKDRRKEKIRKEVIHKRQYFMGLVPKGFSYM